MPGGADDTETLWFRYRARRGSMVLAGLFFAACAIVLTLRALENDRGLIINHIITLDQSEAGIFYWMLAGLSVGFVLVAVAVLIASFGPERWITLGGDALSAPKGPFRKGEVRIAFRAVSGLQRRQVYGQRFIEIHTSDGRKLTIAASMLESAAAFEDLAKNLIKRGGLASA